MVPFLAIPPTHTFALQWKDTKLLLLSIMYTTRCTTVYGTSLLNAFLRFAYFLIRAGAVDPAESPLSPA